MSAVNPVSDPAGGSVALRLPNTDRGRAWLSQFDAEDQELATRLLGALTLVSHSAFERALQALLLSEAEKVDGPVALYATRESEPDVDYFDTMADPDDPFAALSSVAEGADLGSEARIATLIRNLSKASPEKLLNHPSLETLRAKRARSIFVVDDIIGSGKRTSDFLRSMWQSASITSWHSRHQIGFRAVAFTGTDMGIRRVGALRSKPLIVIARDCPTFSDLPWNGEIEDAITALCDRYGRRTSRPRMRLGFAETMAALVFEHGCPNNTPSILWAPQSAKSNWRPLFPDRTVLPEVASAFPPDILARDPVAILTDMADGETQVPPAILGDAPLGMTTTTVLALVANGVRSRAALSFATGYDAWACTELLDRCVARGYLSATLRLTAAGRAELSSDGRSVDRLGRVPPIGDDDYYPKQLRGPP